MVRISGEIRRAVLIWSAANILGLSVPPLIMSLIPQLTAISGLLSTILIISLPLSLAQWIALRRTLPVSISWIFSLPVSILVLVLIIRELPEDYWGYIDPESLVVLSASAFVIGLIIAIPQWLILRLEYDGSSIWLLGTVLGVGLGASIVIGTDLVNASGVLAYIFAALFYVLMTGLTLSVLISRGFTSKSTSSGVV
jgi:hypothetical protein